MSSTNRAHGRGGADFYRTPQWAIDVLLERVALKSPVLDPGCGDGAILEGLREAGHGPLVGVELDPERAAAAAAVVETGRVVCDDLFDVDLGSGWRAPASAVSNPPYNIAQPFIERTLTLCQPGARCFFLLRLAFLSGQKRCASGLFDQLVAVYVLPRRPSFVASGSGDSTDYAWFEFSSTADVRSSARLEWLGDGRTP